VEDVTVNITDLAPAVILNITEAQEDLLLQILDAGVRKQMKQEWVDPYLYIGKAVKGALTTDAVWKIFKIRVNLDGTVVVTRAVLVKWSDRLTVIYN
jgi:hypothetical protein